MRWVLIRPLNQSLFYDPEIQEPLGLEYLAATLRKLGCSVLVLDSALDNLNDKKLARRAVAFEPDVIGFSITTDRELDSVFEIYSECRNILNKNICWLAGGNYVTTESSNALEKLPIEYHLVKYEGESVVTNICELWNNGNISLLPKLIDGEPAVELDKLNFPERPYHFYLKNYGWAFNLQGSRGCCSACKYCASRGMRSRKLSFWRGRTPENIVEEISWLNKTYSAQAFNFVDEDFLGPPAFSLERAKRFSAAIIGNNLKITFGIQVRPNSLSEEVIDTLASAGLKYVFMGIESDDPDDFKKWVRKYCEKTWDWVKYLQKNDIEVNAGTLLFHPDSTFEGIRDFATKLYQHGLLNFRTATNRLDAMPGSFFHEQYISQNQESGYTGIFRLPFKVQKMEEFYTAITETLAPIDAPSMHALCSVPIVQVMKYFENSCEKFDILKSINYDCDEKVSACFFAILEMFESNNFSEQIAEELIKSNLAFSKSVAERLIENGFVSNPEVLHNTIAQFEL